MVNTKKVQKTVKIDRRECKRAIQFLSEYPLLIEESATTNNRAHYFYKLVQANLTLGRFGEAIKLADKAKDDKVLSKCWAESMTLIGFFYEYHGRERNLNKKETTHFFEAARDIYAKVLSSDCYISQETARECRKAFDDLTSKMFE